MPMNYSTAVKNARQAAVVTALGTSGVLVIGTSALNGDATGVLATIPLPNPAFTVSGGVMTLGSLPRTANASATGTAAKAEFRDGSGTVIASGLVLGTSAGPGVDIVINALDISNGQVVQVTMGTITHA